MQTTSIIDFRNYITLYLMVPIGCKGQLCWLDQFRISDKYYHGFYSSTGVLCSTSTVELSIVGRVLVLQSTVRWCTRSTSTIVLEN